MRCVCNRFAKRHNDEFYECKCGNRFELVPSGFFMCSDGETYLVVDNKFALKPKEEKKMPFMNVDHSQAGSAFELVAPGKYEVVVSKLELKTSNSGNEMLSVQLTIRNDIDQPHQKQKLFDNLVATEKAMFKFQQVAKAMQLENGESVDTLADFARLMQFRPFKVTVKHETSTEGKYAGQTQARVAFYDAPEVDYNGAGGNGDPFADNGKPVDISEDDLPF